MRYTNIINASVLLFCLLAIAHAAQGQLTLSPFSRFGLGDPASNQEIGSISLGGITAVHQFSGEVNSSNPASYSSLIQPSFQVSLRGQLLRLSNENASANINGSNINSIQLGVPFGKRWGLNLGLLPHTTVGYNVTSKSELQDGTAVTETFDGTGGLNKAVVGLSKQLRFEKNTMRVVNSYGNQDSLVVFKNLLSLGVNFNALFGEIERNRLSNFQDNSFLDLNVIEKNAYSGANATFGLIYKRNLGYKIDKDKQVLRKRDVIVGYTNTIGGTLKNQFSEERQTIEATGFFTTIASAEEVRSPVIPMRQTFGLAYETYWNDHTFRIAGQYSLQDWTGFTGNSTTTVASFGEELTTSLGLQYTPQLLDKDVPFYKATTYRLGLRQNMGRVQTRGNELTDQALTAGLSIPLLASRSLSRFNFGMEVGERGNVTNNLLKEEYINLYFGFTLTPGANSRWFVQRKYN